MVQTKVVEKNETHFTFNLFFPKTMPFNTLRTGDADLRF